MRLRSFGIGSEATVVFDIDDVRFAQIVGRDCGMSGVILSFASRDDLCVYKCDGVELFEELRDWIDTRDWGELDTVLYIGVVRGRSK